MTLRGRFALVSAIAVAVTIVAASVIVFLLARDQLRDQVDSSLAELAEGSMLVTAPLPPPGVEVERVDASGRGVVPRRGDARRGHVTLALPEQPLGLPGGFGQLVDEDGELIPAPGADGRLPVGEATREVATGERGSFYEDLELGGAHIRVLTAPAAPGQAVQVARSLEEVDATLARLGAMLGVVSLAGIALAAVLGRAISRTAVAPVARLTEAAEHVTHTRDLASRIDEPGREDELGRLASSFNAMLAELERAVGAQRQLVADASHELRTPLTSLRTNVELLAGANRLPERDRRRLLADVLTQLGELGTLVANLMELARDEEPSAIAEDLRLDELVAEAVARVRRHAPGRRFVTELEPCLVHGAAERLDRAVSNLLENAAKWSPPEAAVEVSVTRAGEVEVRDHGPGIDPADLPRVFDRFYRAASARAMAGSGLGLAIVRQIAEAHEGTVSAEAAPGGGTSLRLRIPPLASAREPNLVLS